MPIIEVLESDEEDEVPVPVRQRPAGPSATPPGAAPAPAPAGPGPTAYTTNLEDIDEDDDEVAIEEVPEGAPAPAPEPEPLPMDDAELGRLECTTDLYALLGADRADAPHVIDERYRRRKAHFTQAELLDALDAAPPQTRRVAVLKAIVNAFNVLADGRLRTAYDDGGVEAVEEADQRHKILQQMKAMDVNDKDFQKAQDVLQEAEEGRRQLRSGGMAKKKAKEVQVKTVAEKRQLREQLEEAEMEYDWRREMEREREQELKEQEREEKERRYEEDKARQLQMLEEKEDDLLAFLDADRFKKKR